MDLPPKLSRFLLDDADPSVRFFTYRDLLGRLTGDPELEAARREIGKEGWAARILARQQSGGHWETYDRTPASLYRPKYIATNWCLLMLAELGMDRSDARVATSVDLLLRTCNGPEGWFGLSKSHLCITGNAARYLTLLGYGDDPAVGASLSWLVAAQKEDGGWHCFEESTGTIDGWEAMAAFAAVPPARRTPEMARALGRGADFYLDRGLLRETDGSTAAAWHRLHYPTHYYYDLLLGLEFLTELGYGRDPRMGPALDALLSKRNADGTWNLEAVHPDLEPDDPYYVGQMARAPIHAVHFERLHAPSRWNTMRALRVLARSGRATNL